MKKNFKYYAACWLILFAILNAVLFIMPERIAGVSKFTASYWVSYVFIVFSLIGNLGCAWFAFKDESKEKLFLNIPLISISYTALILMLIVSAIFMLIPGVPYWIGAAICLILLAGEAVALITAKQAAEIVSTVDDKVKAKTAFIKGLNVQSEALFHSAKSSTAKAAAKEVYDALLYSDPISNEALNEIEMQIELKFSEFSEAVAADDGELASSSADELVCLIKERAAKCKAMK